MRSAGNEISEPRANLITLRRKTGNGYANAAYLREKRPRLVEDMDVRMLREPEVRETTTLVVARHHVDRHATVCYALERFEGLPDHAARRPRPIEHIATVHNEIDFTSDCRLQRGGIVCQEVVSTSSSTDARVDRQIEAQVRIREEEDPDDVAHTETYLVIQRCQQFPRAASLEALFLRRD
jgi:hypothetical protein